MRRRWFLARADAVQELELEINSADCWAVVNGVAGILGRQLRHLRIEGDGEETYEPGGTAGGLAGGHAGGRGAGGGPAGLAAGTECAGCSEHAGWPGQGQS